ncbi:LacI family DNA-binding transcriptional regulator [Cellulosimicrobium marinum]|uniref:LacI family DNA-binding transcriptional regulator n=1 Tax=Cellulosimicrobium marinum TaxID=1638992 RepID=UPI00226CA56B|nr:LacI family DNA-binding transcriptional regulator [Cellulosimicrobium marinum]MCB7135083.1 LacI family transcriptional regulator [Cellulosimicrobium marinum]
MVLQGEPALTEQEVRPVPRTTGSRGGRRPTLASVAELAGVSLKTASRVLNDEPNVAPQTREKVQDAARQLGFRRNAVAADLARGGSSRLVGFVTGDLANPFYSALAAGIERELRPHGLQLITTSSDEEPEREHELTEALVERRVGALVVTPTATDHSALRHELAGGLPVVFVDRPAEGVEADTVVIDNRGGVRDAVTHLLAHGHRRIALVGDESRLWTFQERCDEFVTTLRAAGVEDPDRYVRAGAHDAGLARTFVAELLAMPEPPTALLTANNKITKGALHALREHGTDAQGRPRVALVGFDDFELADLLDVTVVGYDVAEMGRQAASLAVSRAADPTLAPRLVVVPTRVVVRGTGEVSPVASDA